MELMCWSHYGQAEIHEGVGSETLLTLTLYFSFFLHMFNEEVWRRAKLGRTV
jgi:hypothetical protein